MDDRDQFEILEKNDINQDEYLERNAGIIESSNQITNTPNEPTIQNTSAPDGIRNREPINRKKLKKKKKKEKDTSIFTRLKEGLKSYKDRIINAYNNTSSESKSYIKMAAAGAGIALGAHITGMFSRSDQPLYRENINLDLNKDYNINEHELMREKLRRNMVDINVKQARGELKGYELEELSNEIYNEEISLNFKVSQVMNSRKIPSNIIYNFDLNPEITRIVVSLMTRNYRVNTSDLNQYFVYDNLRFKSKFRNPAFLGIVACLMFMYNCYVEGNEKIPKYEDVNKWINEKDIPSIIGMSKILGNGLSPKFMRWAKKLAFRTFQNKYKDPNMAPRDDEIDSFISAGEINITE